MIRLLIVLHPRVWRRRYGEEFQALLDATPITAVVVLDVMFHAAGQHGRARPWTARVLGAIVVSILVELAVLSEHLTDNILWAPTTQPRSLALFVLLLAWLPVLVRVVDVVRRGRDLTT